MNKLIQQELNNCNVAIIPKFDDSITTLYIERGIRKITEIQFEVGKYYQIELEDILIHPTDNFILHSQWNNNVVPKNYIMNVEIIEIMGKMIKVRGTSIPSYSTWVGWLPKDLIHIKNLL